MDASLSMLKANTDVFIAVGIIGILLVMILPLPAPVLDLLLAMNLALSLVTLLVALYTLEPPRVRHFFRPYCSS